MAAHPAPRRLALVLGVLAAALALTGCDLRLETPPPTAPAAGPAEQVRERTVADALALAASARSAGPAADEATAAVLDDVAAFSAAHASQLGGVYDSGLPTPTDTPTPTADVATPGDVLVALRADAGTALADATAADDGATARLLAAIGVARDELADRLAVALNEPAPAPTPGPTTSPAPAATPDDAATTPVPTGSPTATPDDTAALDLAPLVLAHDQAGFGLEVVAAKLTGDDRTAAVSAAAAHRAAGEAWARRAGIASTAGDPRRAVYALPAGLDDPAGARALAASLETGVADAASATLLSAPVELRADLLDELRTATAAAATWGAAPTAFPGIAGLD